MCRNFILEESETCKLPWMFNCSDSHHCIHKDLVCDGHVQCDDGSDEDEDLCKVCPTPGKNPAATFSCIHRYTNKRICAVPCDQKDDLCKNNEDEICELLSKSYLALIAGILIVLIAVTGEVLVCLLVSQSDSGIELSDAEDPVNKFSMVQFTTEARGISKDCKLNWNSFKKASLTVPN